MVFGSFTLVLALAYTFTAHPKTISRAGKVVSSKLNLNVILVMLPDSIADTAAFLYNYAIFPAVMLILVVGVAFVVFFVYKKRKIAQESLERRTMELVDKIAGKIYSYSMEIIHS
jgi:hypothetical protein